MAHNTIAVVSDCDDTLAPDTTLQLLEACGIDGPRFFAETVAPLVEDGWDPALAYLQKIAEFAQSGMLPGLNRQRIEEIGQVLKFYPGVPQCFGLLKDGVRHT